MKRRAFLATTAVVATTGCLGRAVSDGDGPTTRDETTTPDGNGTTTSDDEASCPDLHDSVDATVCAGAQNSLGVSFGQSSDRLARGDTLEATLVNEDAESVGLNPYDWAVYRETGDGWEPVDPRATIEPWVVLDAGERLHWRVGVGDASPEASDDNAYGGSVDIEAGEYAFAATADVAGDRASLVAPFTVE